MTDQKSRLRVSSSCSRSFAAADKVDGDDDVVVVDDDDDDAGASKFVCFLLLLCQAVSSPRNLLSDNFTFIDMVQEECLQSCLPCSFRNIVWLEQSSAE